MNWLIKIAGPEKWLRSQGVSDEILQYALNDNKFPRKMQKWIALQLHKKFKSKPEAEMRPQNYDYSLIEVRDWFNHMSRTQPELQYDDLGNPVLDEKGNQVRVGFSIYNYTIDTASDASAEWQHEMADERGEGHARFYSQPDYNAQDLGNGFRMVEVVSDDLENEGAIMQHCVGDDAQEYSEKVRRGKSKIFSLRDSRGWPHATIEVQNENEFDIEAFDNDPKNWVYDENGEVKDIDYEAAGDRQAEWVITQIQGKQNEPPVNKYRPFLKTWLEGHPEFNPSEDDILSVTPSPELLQTIMSDNLGQSEQPDLTRNHGSIYQKYSSHLDEADMVRLMSQIISDQGVGWSDEAIKDAISKPVINGWYEIPETDESGQAAGARFLHGGNEPVMDRGQHNTFIRSLTNHDSPDIRRAAYSRMGADSRYRTQEGLQEFMQVALEEPSAKVVAVILPNFFTYPNKESPDHMERYRNPVFSPDLFPFATQLSEKFKGAPDSDELHAKVVQGLTFAPQTDPQMIARAVTNRFVGQRIGDGSTYEIRHALEKMDSSRFGQVWALLDPTLRRFMLSEDIKGYNSMVGQQREILDQYPNEMAMKYENGGLAPPGVGTVFQPESTQNLPVTQERGFPQRDELGQALYNQFGPLQIGPPPGFPGREASSWIQRIG